MGMGADAAPAMARDKMPSIGRARGSRNDKYRNAIASSPTNWWGAPPSTTNAKHHHLESVKIGGIIFTLSLAFPRELRREWD